MSVIFVAVICKLHICIVSGTNVELELICVNFNINNYYFNKIHFQLHETFGWATCFVIHPTEIIINWAMAHPVLDYANSILSGLSNANCRRRFQKGQNTLVRVAPSNFTETDSNKFLRELHWLPVNCSIEYKLARLTYNSRAVGQQTYWNSLLTFYLPARDLRSPEKDLLLVPDRKTNFDVL